jgi:hypothetical protein
MPHDGLKIGHHKTGFVGTALAGQHRRPGFLQQIDEGAAALGVAQRRITLNQRKR